MAAPDSRLPPPPAAAARNGSQEVHRHERSRFPRKNRLPRNGAPGQPIRDFSPTVARASQAPRPDRFPTSGGTDGGGHLTAEGNHPIPRQPAGARRQSDAVDGPSKGFCHQCPQPADRLVRFADAMVGEGQIRQGRGLGHMTRRAIGAAGTAANCPPHMARPALGIVGNARGGIGVRIMACDAIERLFGPAAAHITAAHRQAHRSKTHTQRIFHLRCRRGILAQRRTVAGSAGRHGTVTPDRLCRGMSPLRAVAALTMHPRTIRRHVTAKAAGRVLIALHHAKRLLP
jgi:hypothetical protein